MRDIYTDPRVGDYVQIIPRLGAALPEPIEITEITPRWINWKRPVSSNTGTIALMLWMQPRGFSLELLRAAPNADESQPDMFGGAA